MKIEDLKISRTSAGITFQVKVAPAGSRTSIEGIYDDMLKVKLAAAPEKGKANKALIDFLSDRLGIKKKFITITSGRTSKVKLITIEQETAETLVEKLKSVL